ncbi:MAG TPA: hypothetical protein VK923_06740 [Euzebyales bacterium]|nr:hypothetical protein [Euzebyales bacterium]
MIIPTDRLFEAPLHVASERGSRTLACAIAAAGPDPEVVVEPMGGTGRSTCCRACGASVHLAHALGVKAFAYRRVKNDVRDATDLADLLPWAGWPRRGSHRRLYGSCASSCGTARSWSRCAPG